MNRYEWTIRYDVAGRAPRALLSAPAVACAEPTPEERETQIARSIEHLTHQPTEPHYIVLAVERRTLCAPCEGTGTLRHKPKSWRKRTPPPAWMYTRTPCQDCAGTGTAGA